MMEIQSMEMDAIVLAMLRQIGNATMEVQQQHPLALLAIHLQ